MSDGITNRLQNCLEKWNSGPDFKCRGGFKTVMGMMLNREEMEIAIDIHDANGEGDIVFLNKEDAVKITQLIADFYGVDIFANRSSANP